MTSPHAGAGRSLAAPLVVIGAIIVLGCVALLLDARRPACPPDVPRPWAAEAFAERTADAPPAPWPTVAEVGPEPGPATVSADGTEIEAPPGPRAVWSGDAWRLYRRIAVGPGETAALPGAGAWRARLAAWRAPGTAWLDPRTGEPMVDEVDGPTPIHLDGPALEAIIDVRPGAGSAMGRARLNSAQLFDRRTGVKLNTGAAWRQPGERGVILAIETGLAHRADLMLEVQLCYGDSPAIELDARDGAEGSSADGVIARVERMSSGRSVGTSWGSRRGFMVRLDGVDPAADPTLAVVSIWPRAWADRAVVSAHPDAGWTTMIGHNALGTVTWRNRPVPETVEVRLLPQTVRLQFTLPPAAPLPEVGDLFELPAPNADGHDHRYFTELEQRLQIDLDPLTAVAQVPAPEGATCGEAVRRILDGSGMRLDRDGFVVTDRSAGVLERIGRRISGVLP